MKFPLLCDSREFLDLIKRIAARIGKIPYHLLTAILKRVQRVYVME